MATPKNYENITDIEGINWACLGNGKDEDDKGELAVKNEEETTGFVENVVKKAELEELVVEGWSRVDGKAGSSGWENMGGLAPAVGCNAIAGGLVIGIVLGTWQPMPGPDMELQE